MYIDENMHYTNAISYVTTTLYNVGNDSSTQVDPPTNNNNNKYRKIDKSKSRKATAKQMQSENSSKRIGGRELNRIPHILL